LLEVVRIEGRAMKVKRPPEGDFCVAAWQIEKAAGHFSPPKNALRPPGEN